MHSYRGFLLIFVSGMILLASMLSAPRLVNAQQGQRLVESVDITGNRRLRKDDILYYVQTRPGDPFNEQQVQRDLQAILALGFFDKTKTRVLTEDGARGGINVIFEVTELPIIRDLQFEGLKSVPESDVLKAFREKRVGVSKESIYDPVKARNAIRVLKELLASHGHPNATIEERRDEVSATSTALTFVINEGERVRVVEIQFEGNTVFSDGKLRSAMKYVKEAGLITRFKGLDILDREKLEFDLRHVDNYMRSKGYLQARHGEPRVESVGPRRTGFPILPLPFLSSVDEGLRVTVPIVEGRIYRIGEMKIEGNSIFPEEAIRGYIGLNKGDVANGEKIGKALFENLKKVYGGQGFIEYTAEPTPTFKDNPQKPDEGIVDFVITIEEGKQFSLRRLEFVGNTFTRDNVLRREVLLNEGDIYNQTAWEFSIIRLNQLGYFDPIDKEKDADFKTNEEEATVDINLKVSERGRQQISFNGGLSGIGGSFFGLEYSTNNLLGRGEILSLNLSAGNRQQYLQFSFTEPYIRNRPITAGFSLFGYTQKFFGEGTFLSQNVAAQQGLSGSQIDALNVGEENLFTRTSYGGSLFASAPLSEFYRKRRFTQLSRIGASYQVSTSTVKDPAVNSDPNNPTKFIPVVYSQPNILTSRGTVSFAYDTRNASVDPTTGRELSVQVAVAGFGGDVRTYQPTLSYTQFFPMRRKRSDHPEVFGFRILAGSVGSFATSAKVRNANSLAFVDGVPIFERFFLGDEFTVRGYNVRSITPLAPLDNFITSRNVVVASNGSGTPVAVPGVPASVANVGVFTGATGSNIVQLPRSFTPIGGDSQVLGNFEYRIPVIGNTVGLAAFADIGSSFNLRSKRDQFFSSNFLNDQPFLSSIGLVRCDRAPGGIVFASLSAFAACFANTDLALLSGTALIMRDNRLVTTQELDNARSLGPFDPTTGLPFGFQPVFLRGEAQTNTAVRISQSLFSKFGDYRASLGMEVRVQVPVINVPFRLIFAYNPKARNDQVIDGFPFIFNEKKKVIRFSVGRTF
ncbi:MAG TPA: outer membrane protein assembly factor BamA [Blastocatellia bacterium]|nr:outer membrane protein assembly factor BamA [Blastocatellia bacterium]HCX31657.1 outer membrane protein assembly factor BamA [Blastocatellia bacterium]